MNMNLIFATTLLYDIMRLYISNLFEKITKNELIFLIQQKEIKLCQIWTYPLYKCMLMIEKGDFF
jgi:hypothetical protein